MLFSLICHQFVYWVPESYSRWHGRLNLLYTLFTYCGFWDLVIVFSSCMFLISPTCILLYHYHFQDWMQVHIQHDCCGNVQDKTVKSKKWNKSTFLMEVESILEVYILTEVAKKSVSDTNPEFNTEFLVLVTQIPQTRTQYFLSTNYRAIFIIIIIF